MTTIAATQSTATTPAATTPQGSSTLGQDAFFKLLVAQLSNQDPTQPMQGTEFVTQLSQFSLVEQAVAQSTTLGNVSAQLKGMSSNEAVGLVGKNVTLQMNGLTFDGVTATSGSVTLGGASAKTTATIVDSQGNVVRTLDLGAQPAGPLPITWDGRNDQGVPAPKGNYTLSVSAADGGGNAVSVSQNVSGLVQAVSFASGYAQLQLTNGVSAPISDLMSVSNAPSP